MFLSLHFGTEVPAVEIVRQGLEQAGQSQRLCLDRYGRAFTNR